MIKAKIDIPYFSVRLLTVICYFLPLIYFLSTCTSDLTSKEAFNNEDALLNEKEKLLDKLKTFDELTKQIDIASNNVSDVVTEIRQHIKTNRSDNTSNLQKDIQIRLLCPTDYSLSGIGALYFHKNLFARLSLGLSIFLSLIILLFWRIIKKKKLSLLFIATNMGAVFIFMIICFITNVSILYGSWILLLLLSNQILTEIQTLKKSTA